MSELAKFISKSHHDVLIMGFGLFQVMYMLDTKIKALMSITITFYTYNV